MKKLLLLTALLIAFLGQAQFAPGNLKELTQADANAFAREIAANAKTSLEFLTAKENTKGDYYIVNFGSGEKKLKVVFNVYLEGENKALEIQGIKTYRFREASGTYLDLFTSWKKIFRPDVDIEKTIDDINSQELINRADGINFKLKGQDSYWTITNWI